jgi:hypothetical protein
MPYRRTGRPPGRPRRYPMTASITELERKAANARRTARYYQQIADERIAAELAAGKTRQQVASSISKTTGHVRVAIRRHNRRTRQEAPGT